MINSLDCVKGIDAFCNYVEGPIININEKFYIINKKSLIDSCEDDKDDLGFSLQFTRVDKTNCAKKLFDLPNNESLYEFDVFLTPDENNSFYITFDYTRLAVVYHSVDDSELPNDINIFNCKRIGNVIIDGVFNIE